MDGTGAVHLVDFADGDIAASELVLRCDLAQLLTTLALRAGAARSVRTAVAVLGPDTVGAALPSCSPSPSPAAPATRSNAPTGRPRPDGRHHGTGGRHRQSPARPRTAPDTAAADGAAGGLLEEIRAEVLRTRPQAVVRPVRLERLKRGRCWPWWAGWSPGGC